eukprot:6475457-Amphidinium_carterae.1
MTEHRSPCSLKFAWWSSRCHMTSLSTLLCSLFKWKLDAARTVSLFELAICRTESDNDGQSLSRRIAQD